MYSHHSHSLDYVAHGVDHLESVVARANHMHFELFCLTEHMPRISAQLLYPEEATGNAESDLETLRNSFEKFLVHAAQIKKRNLSTKIIIGMEVEGCDLSHIAYAKDLMEENKRVIQFCIGSIHHVNGIPIDFDRSGWDRALKSAGNNLRSLLRDYFEQQYELIRELKPLVLGHFDLFRLFCTDDLYIDAETGEKVEKLSSTSVRASEASFPALWDDIKGLALRNLEAVASYGGLIEINTSGLRKNLRDPYPHRDFATLAQSVAGTRFVLSDDAHGVAHVGVCYDKALAYMSNILNLERLHYLTDVAGVLEVQSKSLEKIRQSSFWEQYL
ncbi:LADA_0H16732g1_1 [Lachancea dasiensis]|uniref:Histidinol-phosphatase n=1 Tax=Lachancea dasiensis TaxID=1072105 RepID=A0A1G4K5E5_9SACH|nr:LADA_0H16732g1_1 [Lachancea dasiensis]